MAEFKTCPVCDGGANGPWCCWCGGYGECPAFEAPITRKQMAECLAINSDMNRQARSEAADLAGRREDW
jgi:hypothetical protein